MKYPSIDAIHGNESGTIDQRHVRIDLRNHESRGLDRRQNDIDGNTEVDEAERVRRCRLNERDVHADSTRANELRDLREENGCIVCSAFMNRFADIGSNEKRIVPKAILVPTVDIRCRSKSKEMYHKVVSEMLCSQGKCFHQSHRFGCPRSDENMLPFRDALHDVR